ncbi:MAG TPA: hypothetical protein VGO49_18510 [Bradyrhizobium sp.]|nr:hypothetical protein [Bradyrhizobium sp.]
MADGGPQFRERPWLGLLILFHIAMCCVSLVYLSNQHHPVPFNPAAFHLLYDPARLAIAIIVVAAFALVSCLFVFSRFSFGYFAGFYFYTMILGYLWLNCFTDLNYDHRLAGLSAAASAVAFLLPALFISSPLRQAYVLSAEAFDRLLTSILVLGVATCGLGAIYNFRLVGIEDIYPYREKLGTPAIVNYLVTIVSNALLPFAFAGFAATRAHWRAGAVLVLLLFFYPITLSKITFFAPLWLVVMLVLSRIFEPRITVVLSLLGPMLAGLAAIILFRADVALFFSTANFRMIAIPSLAMNVYNDFFSKHDLTYFCQISVLKRIMSCPYQEQLSLVMEKAYKLGNFNASLFATEGIASVGPLFAPIATFACGLVIALGNRLSAGLPLRFILVSGAILPPALLNVALSTVLLTHGLGILFLLWYITPRAIFQRNGRTDD